MAVLVTRPHPDDEATATALRARGFEALLAPMLRFEPVAFQDDLDARYGAVVVTSANALRGLELKGHRLLELPLFAVGEHTAERGAPRRVHPCDARQRRRGGLARPRAGAGEGEGAEEGLDAALSGRRRSGTGPRRRTRRSGLRVVTHTTYRMVPVANLPPEVCDAFAANRIEAVLHYSRRSARAFLDAARAGGVEISALSIPQCCISASVAAVVREAGAAQVMVAATPDENALFEALERALRA